MDYYENKSTKQIFISLDEGETLINPAGKKISCNDKLFEELEEAAPITEAQKKVAEVTEAFAEKKEAFDIEYEQKNTRLSYEGCKMSLRDKLDIEEGKKVIVLDGNKHFTLLSTEGLTEEEIEQKKQDFIATRKMQAQRRFEIQSAGMDRLNDLIKELMGK